MRKSILLMTFLLAIGLTLGVAQDDAEIQPAETEEVEVDTGLFTPDSALYGVETAYDSMAMSVGISNPVDVAEKRAAEAEQMAEEGNWEAAERAANGLETAASNAEGEDIEGIETATARLEVAIEDAPEEALEGLNTAMENVVNAGPEDMEEQGAPEDAQQPDETGQQPDEGSEEAPEDSPEEGEQDTEQPEDEETTEDGNEQQEEQP